MKNSMQRHVHNGCRMDSQNHSRRDTQENDGSDEFCDIVCGAPKRPRCCEEQLQPFSRLAPVA
eukprot:2883586-Lingulodinium_polyedra.AAC.1